MASDDGVRTQLLGREVDASPARRARSSAGSGRLGSRAVGSERFDRVPLLFGPSPVHRLERLSEHLGGDVDIWAKCEDCNSGLAYGGNKVRIE
jgi:hypothetical protein